MTNLTIAEQIAEKAKPMLLQFHEMITLDELISNSVRLSGGGDSYHAEDAAGKAKIVAEHTRIFVCRARVSVNGVNKRVERVLEMDTKLRLKAYHSVQYGEGFPKRKLTTKEQFANVTDMQLKRASRNTLEGAARDMITANERAHQFMAQAAPPVNSKEHVERADYPITSLYSDYKDLIELSALTFVLLLKTFGADACKTLNGLPTWADYHAERKKWRHCKYMYCLNVFPIERDNFKHYPAKRKDARYCCEDCRLGQKGANKRYKTTGSYLPVYFYTERHSETVNDEARLYESAYEGEDIEKEIDKKRPERVQKLKRSNGGGGTRGGVMKKYKSLVDAEKGYAEQDRTGWRKIN